MSLARRPPAFHWRILREEAGGVEGQPGARDSGEGAEEKYTGWPTGDKKFEDEGGAGVQH